MKRIIAIIIIFSCYLYYISSASAHEEPPKTLQEKQKTESTRIKYRDAQIRQVLGFKTTFIDGEAQLPELRASSMTYDTNGCLSEWTSYRNDTLTGKGMNYYNPAFQWVTTLDFEKGTAFVGVDRYEYGDNGLIQQISEYSTNSRLLATEVYAYNSKDRTILITRADSANKTEYTVEYRYAVDIQLGTCTEIIQSDSEGKLKLRVENLYGSDGKRITKRIFNNENQVDYYFEYAYTSLGEFSEITKHAADGTVLTKDIYEYNEKGFPTSITTVNGLNKKQSVISYKYYLGKK